MLGYLLGALDDAEMEQVGARWNRTPIGRSGLTLRRRLDGLDAAGWSFARRPGLAQRTCDSFSARATSRRRPARRSGRHSVRLARLPVIGPAAASGWT